MIRLHSNLMALLKWTQRCPRARALSCGALSALFLILAFPFFEGNGLWWLAILIPVPLMVIANEPLISPSRAALYAGLGTLPAWLWTHHWMWGVTKVGTPFLVLYLMFFVWLFVWAGARICQRFGRAWITLPMVWVGIEFLRGSVALTGYPWYLSAHPLIDSPGQVLAGPAALGGVYLVGLLSAVLGWQLWGLSRGDGFVQRGVGAAGVLGVWVALGVAGIEPGSSESREVTVGIVQPNIPQDNRMDWTDRQRYVDWMMLRELTIASAQDSELTPDFIVWPEGFVPGWTFDPISLQHERDHGFTWDLRPRYVDDAPGVWGLPELIPATTIVDEFLMMQRNLGIPMVVGSVAFDNLKIERNNKEWVTYTNDGMYNSAFSVADGEIGSRWYNKMHLTPFGEVMPVISNWEWLEQQLLGLGATGMEFILSAGEVPVVLEVPIKGGALRVGTPICFEATVPGVCQDLVFEKGQRIADILVNITNDGWFGNWDPSRRTHMLVARWRCVELRTPMVRSANTGISCVIDRRGAVINENLSMMDREDPRSGYLNARVEVGTGDSILIFEWLRSVFGWGMLGMTCVGLILSFIQKRSEQVLGADE
ncbi:MAG: apolipoprotein N-acyltransferase [Phycisphaerales bacterium]|nr:apolipoprotein N-acyltransferase [Phycisphaerales bacterium]